MQPEYRITAVYYCGDVFEYETHSFSEAISFIVAIEHQLGFYSYSLEAHGDLVSVWIDDWKSVSYNFSRTRRPIDNNNYSMYDGERLLRSLLALLYEVN